ISDRLIEKAMRTNKKAILIAQRWLSYYCLTASCEETQYFITLQSVRHVKRATYYGFWSAPTCRFRNAPQLKAINTQVVAHRLCI
ncbi:hypothetical protein ABTP05_19310, partial [Acinetobacter baumannii]